MTGEVKRTVSEVRASYRVALPKRLEDLARELANVTGESGRESLEEASLLAHRLRGTAATFGFLAIGECAGRIEDALARIVGGDDVVRGLALAEIESAMTTALRAMPSSAPSEASAALAQPLEPGPPSVPPPTGTPNASLGVTTKLLLVDDDPAFLDYVEALGRVKLVQILSATTVAEALEVARRDKPQAAIIDIHLGRTERSFRLAQELPKIPGCEAIRVAFISSSASFDDRVASARAGAALYLTKPIDATAFDVAVQQLLAFHEEVTPRVVLLDPSAESREHTLAMLRDCAWRIRTVETPNELLAQLDAEHADLLIARASPESFDACRAIRTSLRWQDLPTVFLTDAKDDAAERYAAFEAGANSYIVRPVPADELVMRLRRRMDRARLARELAGRDRLTGLSRRGAFLDLVGVRISEAVRHHVPLSIAIIDLDHFKNVNDTHGHLAGDQVLLALARLLASRLRTEDVRARWGGEEFVVAFPREGASNVETMLARVLAEFSRFSFVSAAGARFGVTFSAGVASLGDDGADIETLLGTADRRLYAAKSRGRNRIVGHEGTPKNVTALRVPSPAPRLG